MTVVFSPTTGKPLTCSQSLSTAQNIFPKTVVQSQSSLWQADGKGPQFHVTWKRTYFLMKDSMGMDYRGQLRIWHHSLELHGWTQVIALDIFKAFDKVSTQFFWTNSLPTGCHLIATFLAVSVAVRTSILISMQLIRVFRKVLQLLLHDIFCV